MRRCLVLAAVLSGCGAAHVVAVELHPAAVTMQLDRATRDPLVLATVDGAAVSAPVTPTGRTVRFELDGAHAEAGPLVVYDPRRQEHLRQRGAEDPASFAHPLWVAHAACLRDAAAFARRPAADARGVIATCGVAHDAPALASALDGLAAAHRRARDLDARASEARARLARATVEVAEAEQRLRDTEVRLRASGYEAGGTCVLPASPPDPPRPRGACHPDAAVDTVTLACAAVVDAEAEGCARAGRALFREGWHDAAEGYASCKSLKAEVYAVYGRQVDLGAELVADGLEAAGRGLARLLLGERGARHVAALTDALQQRACVRKLSASCTSKWVAWQAAVAERRASPAAQQQRCLEGVSLLRSLPGRIAELDRVRHATAEAVRDAEVGLTEARERERHAAEDVLRWAAAIATTPDRTGRRVEASVRSSPESGRPSR